MGGCDKTGPGLLLGAISAGVPTIFLPAGPMLRGNWNGKVLGSGSDSWKYWDELRAGKITEEDWAGVEKGIARSHGTCMTMGTASTMTAIIEALGMSLPGTSSIPAPDANHPRMAAECGRRIVEMVWEDLTPTPDHHPRGLHQRGGGGDGHGLLDQRADPSARAGAPRRPCRVRARGLRPRQPRGAGDRQRPSQRHHLPDGGLLLRRRHPGADGAHPRPPRHWRLTCTGRSVGENIAGAQVFNDDVIRPLDNPLYAEGALAVLRGNLAPEGCVIKPSAMEPRFLKHAGPALVFDDYPSMKKAVDDENLDVTADHVLVLRNAGPQGGPGMPEWGMLPMPRKLLKQGHRDMLRLSDARMSGTSYGACVLHVAPESYVGGPLALLRTGDIVEIDVPSRRINMRVSEEELARRRAAWTPPPPRFDRGYGWMFNRHIRQANEGCDFDFLKTEFGAAVGEPAIY